MSGPVAALLPDGRRLHLQHGPIDLVIGADAAAPGAVAAAYDAAVARFDTILPVLVEELTLLRSPCPPEGLGLAGPVARRMEAAVLPFAADRFVTPMAAVAGAVADEILAAMVVAAPLARAYVNDGGDIALYLAPGTEFALQIAALDRSEHGRVRIAAGSPVRGVATSGRGGRSFSLGIADAVTVLAHTAAAADAAATLIANAVDLPGHPAVERAPARALQPDSDLGERLVTVACGPLAADEIDAALERGLAEARRMQAAGLVAAAALFLQGECRVTEGLAPPVPKASRPALPRQDGHDTPDHDATLERTVAIHA